MGTPFTNSFSACPCSSLQEHGYTELSPHHLPEPSQENQSQSLQVQNEQPTCGSDHVFSQELPLLAWLSVQLHLPPLAFPWLPSAHSSVPTYPHFLQPCLASLPFPTLFPCENHSILWKCPVKVPYWILCIMRSRSQQVTLAKLDTMAPCHPIPSASFDRSGPLSWPFAV